MTANKMPSKTTKFDNNKQIFRLKDYYSALTHFIGFVFSIVMTPVLLIRASANGATPLKMLWYSIFMIGLILLYGASTAYHSFNISEKANRLLKKLDHSMIFILIAGSYTPVCMIGLNSKSGLILCVTVWAIALVGIIVKLCWIDCPKWFSSIIYIALGWACVFQLGNIYQSLPRLGFGLLLAGGIFYSIGGFVYALKIKGLSKGYGREFGMHEIFHVFIMIGSLCHYLMVFFVLTKM